jgi:hypothetical protein
MTNLGFLLRENSLLYSSNLPLGVPNWTVIYTITHCHSKDFSGAVAGEKEDFCKGSFVRTSFTLFFVFLYFIFTCIVFIKNTQKIVPTIVVIFVGLLLSCFIMLSINGWFL